VDVSDGGAVDVDGVSVAGEAAEAVDAFPLKEYSVPQGCDMCHAGEVLSESVCDGFLLGHLPRRARWLVPKFMRWNIVSAG